MARSRIPNKLKRYRKLAGYSQKDVATILRFKSTNRICGWEKGTIFPSIKNLLKLSILYSTLPAQLYSDLYQMLREDLLASKKVFLLKRSGKQSTDQHLNSK